MSPYAVDDTTHRSYRHLTNDAHLELLASDDWRMMLRDLVLPFAFGTMPVTDLGSHVLEIGPGPGLTTDLLVEAERGFRDLKSTLELRPVFHRLEPRIRAHVLLCWLALLLVRVAERRCATTWRRIATELSRVHAVTLTGTAGTVIQTTPPSATPTGFLAACGIDPLPRITHLHPA